MRELLLVESGFPQRSLGVERVLRPLQRVHLGAGPALRALQPLLERALHDGEVGEEQFPSDLRELPRRCRVGAEAAEDDRERVGLAQLRHALGARRAARDVDEADLRRHGLLRTLHVREHAEARIRDRHDRDVRLPAVRAGAGERGEERGLPREGHADQTDVTHRSANVSAGSRPTFDLRPLCRRGASDRCLRTRPAGTGVPPDPPRCRRFSFRPVRGVKDRRTYTCTLAVRVAGGRVFPTAPPAGLSPSVGGGWNGEGPSRDSGPAPPGTWGERSAFTPTWSPRTPSTARRSHRAASAPARGPRTASRCRPPWWRSRRARAAAGTSPGARA